MRDLKSKMAAWDAMIRAGRAGDVRASLAELKSARIPRALYVDFSAICRRADHVSLGLKLLNPIVRGRRRNTSPPTARETAEYAALLSRIGAGDESISLLCAIDRKACPEASLYLAFAHVSQWNYRESIKELEMFLASSSNPYSRMIASVNLAAGWVWEHPGEKARTLLAKLLEECQASGNFLLQGNLLELLAQNAIACNEYQEAKAWLIRAGDRLAAHGGRESLYVQKWRALLHLKQEGPDDKVLREISRVRETAEKVKHWESLRQIDFFCATVLRDPALFQKLYYGTPFTAFRERVLQAAPTLKGSDAYEWRLSPGRNTTRIDPNRLPELGRLAKRTLFALCSDFYRPLRMATAFYRIYPDEFYNPVHSPNRLHFAMKTLRRDLASDKIPLQVISEKEGYRLQATSPLSLVVPAQFSVNSTESDTVQRLQKAFGGSDFSSGDAASKLEMPLRSIHRHLARAVDSRLLLRTGAGKNTRYRAA